VRRALSWWKRTRLRSNAWRAVTVIIASGYDKIVLTSLDEYFYGWVLHDSSLHSALEYGHATIAALNNPDSVIDKYKTCVFSTTCDSPTDAISDYLWDDRVNKRFVATSFFLVAAVAYSWWFFGFIGVITVNIINIFPSVNKIVITSLD